MPSVRGVGMSERVSGIYGIYCEETNRWYVGASVDMMRRMRDHFYEMRVHGHRGERGEMGDDFALYGESAFVGVVLEFVEPSDLASRESFWAEQLEAVTRGYNEQAPGTNRHWGGDSQAEVEAFRSGIEIGKQMGDYRELPY